MSNRANVTFKRHIEKLQSGGISSNYIEILKVSPKRYAPQILNIYGEIQIDCENASDRLAIRDEMDADERLFFTLHEETAYEFGIGVRKKISFTEVNRILDVNEMRAARYYMISGAMKRRCSRREAINRLISIGFSSEAAETACDYAVEEGYLNEADAAKTFVEIKAGRFSRTRIKQELLKKGFEKEIIRNALEIIESRDEEEMALEEAKRIVRRLELGSEEQTQKSKVRLYSYLLRCGYSYGASKNAVKHLFEKLN